MLLIYCASREYVAMRGIYTLVMFSSSSTSSEA